MHVGFLFLLFPIAALSQEREVQRELIKLQQQSDAFALQLRQSQERVRFAPGDLARQQELEARHLAERQRLENVSERQLREVKADTPPELRPYERARAEEERRAIVEAR